MVSVLKKIYKSESKIDDFFSILKGIVFYKSNISARWWMEVPYPPIDNVKFERHHMVPCNKEDYDFALVGEIPDLWWKTYQKLG